MSSVSVMPILRRTLRMKSSRTAGRRVTAARGGSSSFGAGGPSSFVRIVAIACSRSSSSASAVESSASSPSSTSTSSYMYESSSSSSSSVTGSR